jgi:segregation and condensation protein B
VNKSENVEVTHKRSELFPLLESLLIVADEPIVPKKIEEIIGIPQGDIENAFLALSRQYKAEKRGFELLRVKPDTVFTNDESGNVDFGWQLFSGKDNAKTVEAFLKNTGTQKLSPQALEALAIFAYKQPVTRAQIASIRGVNSDSIIRTLLVRGLIEESNEMTDTGAIKYKTTNYFLEKMGIDSLSDLPPISPLLPTVKQALDENEHEKRLQKISHTGIKADVLSEVPDEQ